MLDNVPVDFGWLTEHYAEAGKKDRMKKQP
jgi:hypothetical protein